MPFTSILTLSIFMLANKTHSFGQQVLPTQPLPRESEDFPRGGKYPKDVPLPKYLAYFPPNGVTRKVLFMC